MARTGQTVMPRSLTPLSSAIGTYFILLKKNVRHLVACKIVAFVVLIICWWVTGSLLLKVS